MNDVLDNPFKRTYSIFRAHKYDIFLIKRQNLHDFISSSYLIVGNHTYNITYNGQLPVPEQSN